MMFNGEIYHAVGRRGMILGLLTGLGIAATGVSAKARQQPRVLFICQYGTAKSAIAREMFRQRARERGIDVSAFSRGITPEEHVSPALREHLIADGIDSAREAVQVLTVQDLRAADIIIAFNILPHHFGRVRLRDWSASPSMNDAYPLARADFIRRIDGLLDIIARRH